MKDLEKLINAINSLNINEIFNDELIRKSIYNNVWFTEKNIADAISDVKRLTNPEKMRQIAAFFYAKSQKSKKIAVVMTGTTPLENFRDFLYILLSGNVFIGKNSNDDPYLPKAFADALISACPELESDIIFTDCPITNFDAIIMNDTAGNSALREYFENVPHLFRRQNLGLYLIKGDEQPADLEQLAYKCFINFGRGNNSVRNIFVPKNYDFTPLLSAFAKWDFIKDNARYFNNYEYRKSACLIGNLQHIDNGFVILRQSDDFNPNVSEIFYHEYESSQEMTAFFEKNKTDDDTLRFLLSL